MSLSLGYRKQDKISRFLLRLHSIALSACSWTERERRINSLVEQYCPDYDTTFLNLCRSYCTEYMNYTSDENMIRMSDLF